MAIISMAGVVIMILGLVAVIRSGWTQKNGADGQNPRWKRKKGGYLVIGAGALVAVFGLSFTIIPTGYTGVRVTFGQVSDEVVPNGFNWKAPFIQTVEKVNNKQQDIVFANQIYSETAERTALYFEGITVTYQIGADKSAWIYSNISDYKENLVSEALVSSAIKASSKKLKAVDATNRSMLEPLAQETIQASLDGKYGEGVVYITKVVIDNVDFDESYNQAIADKQNAQLEYEKQQIENQKEVEKAQAEAEVKKTQAQAEADAMLIEAEAEAAANAKVRDSLNQNVLTQNMLDQWNGEMPKVVGGDNAIFDMSAFIPQQGSAGEQQSSGAGQ